MSPASMRVLTTPSRLGLEPTIEVRNAAGQPAGRQIRHPITWTPAFPAPVAAPPSLGEHSDGVRAWLAAGASRRECRRR